MHTLAHELALLFQIGVNFLNDPDIQVLSLIGLNISQALLWDRIRRIEKALVPKEGK